jgi:hypothetical protein
VEYGSRPIGLDRAVGDAMLQYIAEGLAAVRALMENWWEAGSAEVRRASPGGVAKLLADLRVQFRTLFRAQRAIQELLPGVGACTGFEHGP